MAKDGRRFYRACLLACPLHMLMQISTRMSAHMPEHRFQVTVAAAVADGAPTAYFTFDAPDASSVHGNGPHSGGASPALGIFVF